MGSASDSQITYVASSSTTQPGTYAVNVTALGGSGSTAAGVIDGIAAAGNAQTLTAQPGSGASGLQIQINGGAVGDRGTVTVTQGYASQLDSLLGGFLGTSGVIATQTAGLNQSIKDIGNSRDTLTQRLTALQTSYTRQFSALNAMLGTMQQTSNFLTQQLANLSSLSK